MFARSSGVEGPCVSFWNSMLIVSDIKTQRLKPQSNRAAEAAPFPKTHRISDNVPRSFCVARKSVFLAVSSVVFNISPIVRNFRP